MTRLPPATSELLRHEHDTDMADNSIVGPQIDLARLGPELAFESQQSSFQAFRQVPQDGALRRVELVSGAVVTCVKRPRQQSDKKIRMDRGSPSLL